MESLARANSAAVPVDRGLMTFPGLAALTRVLGQMPAASDAIARERLDAAEKRLGGTLPAPAG